MEIPQQGDPIHVSIRSLSSTGEGVGSLANQMTVFVDGALPGETVTATLDVVKRRYATGTLDHVDVASSERVTPICPAFGRCGGCQIMNLSYQAQLNAKQQRVADALARLAHLDDIDVLPCQPSPTSLAYRNKTQLPVTLEGDTTVMGFYAKRSHTVVPIEKCYIQSELSEELFQFLRTAIPAHNIEPYSEETRSGELRQILIKSSIHRGEVLLVFITTGHGTDKFKRLAAEVVSEVPFVKGVVENINRRNDNIVLGRDFRTLSGQGFIYEDLLGKTFKISPAAFFQVNTLQAEQLYSCALDLAELQRDDKLLDAYCGVGTLSLFAADHAKHVYGIEVVPAAIADAKINAELNGISNCSFLCGKVEDALPKLPPVDAAILNPPRKGCEESVLQAMVKAKPRTIIYISCNPATLARDLHILKGLGFIIDVVQPFDMFPQTMHVETVARLRAE